MKNVHEIEIKVEGKEWEDAITKSFNKNVQNVKVDGFRKGKVPRNIFEKKFGKESLYNDAIDFVLQEKYATVIKDSKLIPIIQPTIDIKEIDDEKLVLTFRITTKPEVKVEKYTKLGVKKGEVKVTDEEVKSRINSLLEQYADIVIKDGKIENGDTAVIDFEGFKDGVAFEGGKAENYPLEIGSNTFIPGFEEQLIGLKAGDEKDIKVNYFIDGKYLEENLITVKFLSENNNIYYLGMDDKYSDEYMLYHNNLIGMNGTNESKYCFTNDKNNETLKICNDYNMTTIKSDVIKDNVYKTIKDKLNNGVIFAVDSDNIDEIKVSINYILSKGYNIVSLEDLLSEKNGCNM